MVGGANGHKDAFSTSSAENKILIVLIYLAAPIVVWFSIGGIKELRSMFRALSTMKRDDRDDGHVPRTDELK